MNRINKTHSRYLAFRAARVMSADANSRQHSDAKKSIVAEFSHASADSGLAAIQPGDDTFARTALPEQAARNVIGDDISVEICEENTIWSPYPMLIGSAESAPSHERHWNNASVHEMERWEASALEHNNELTKAAIQTYFRSTLLPGGYLDNRANNVVKAVRHSDSGSAFHTR